MIANRGVDIVQPDLHYLQQQARERFGQPCAAVKMRVRAKRGGFSGGTVASVLNVLKEVKAVVALPVGAQGAAPQPVAAKKRTSKLRSQ